MFPKQKGDPEIIYTDGDDSEPEEEEQGLINGRNASVIQAEETPRIGDDLQDEFLNGSLASQASQASSQGSTAPKAKSLAQVLRDLEDWEKEHEVIPSDPDSDGELEWRSYIRELPENANVIDAAAKAKEILARTAKDRKEKVILLIICNTVMKLQAFNFCFR